MQSQLSGRVLLVCTVCKAPGVDAILGLPKGYASRPRHLEERANPEAHVVSQEDGLQMLLQHVDSAFLHLIQEKTREEAANAPVKPKFEAFKDFGSEEAAEQAEDKDVAPEPELAPLRAEAARWQAVPDLAPIIASSSGRSPDVSLQHLTGVLALFLIRRCASSVVTSGMCMRWLYVHGRQSCTAGRAILYTFLI